MRRRRWHPTPVLLPGKSHGQRSLVGCSPWGRYKSDTTERLLSLFTFMHWRRKWQPTPVFLPGESQGQGAWWAAIYGVAQSRIRLKRLSSSSSISRMKETSSGHHLIPPLAPDRLLQTAPAKVNPASATLGGEFRSCCLLEFQQLRCKLICAEAKEKDAFHYK